MTSHRQKQAEERRSLAAKTVVTPEMRECILEGNARGDAVVAIRMSLGSNRPSLRKVYQVIAEARAMHEPRASHRTPRATGRPPNPAKTQEPARKPGQPLDGWWFAAETVMVTRLGFGSADCLRVPVSVSAVPTRMAVSRPAEPAERVSVSRSFREALAEHPLVGLSGGHLQPEPAQPHPPR